MVQAGRSDQGFPPAGAAYLVTTPLPQLAGGNDSANLFPTPQDCQTALFYTPGVLSSLVAEFCRSTVPTPAGELAGAGKALAENLAADQRVGPGLPVLLAWEDHDFFFPNDRQTAETQYWMAHCGCDVQSWTESATGHAFTAHLSMPTFTSQVLAWLASKGLAAS